MNRKEAAARRAERGGKPLAPTKVAGEPITPKIQTGLENLAMTPMSKADYDARVADATRALANEERSETDGGHANQDAIGSVVGEVGEVSPGYVQAGDEAHEVDSLLDDILPMGAGPRLIYAVLKAKVNFKSKPFDVLDLTDKRSFVTHALRLSGGMLWFDVEIPNNNGGRFVGCVPIADVKVALYSRPEKKG